MKRTNINKQAQQQLASKKQRFIAAPLNDGELSAVRGGANAEEVARVAVTANAEEVAR